MSMGKEGFAKSAALIYIIPLYLTECVNGVEACRRKVSIRLHRHLKDLLYLIGLNLPWFRLRIYLDLLLGQGYP
jgi:hypothetical protein